jgi:hypothetical protein
MISRFILMMVLLTALFTSALAQDEQTLTSRKTSAPAVTAAVTPDGTVRLTSPGEVSEIRLQIYAPGGDVVFDSGVQAGNVFDWTQNDALKMTADGSYLAVVTVKNLQGKVFQRLGSFNMQAGQLTITRQKQTNLSGQQATALSGQRQAQKIESDNDESLTILKSSSDRAVVVTTHDGSNGQITTTIGDLKLSTGDVLSNNEREQVRITQDGRVGIGTSEPGAKLDVVGVIRARGGIQFEDGTVLNSAKNLSERKGGGFSTTVITPGTQSLAGTGSANRLPKWMDNAGTLGDSSISELNGNLVVNGGNIQMTAAPSLSVDSNLLYMDNNSKTAGIIASSTPAFSANNGPYLAMRGNTYSLYPNQRGALSISAGNVANPVGREGTIQFMTGSDQPRVAIKPNGNVGIGTETPAQKLEVAGNVKISGAGNALFFPDGTFMTTAGAGGGGNMTGSTIVSAINDAATVGVISDSRVSLNLARLNAQNFWTSSNVFVNGLSANNVAITNVGNPVSAGDAVNKGWLDSNVVKLAPGAFQLSVGDANGTAPMVWLRGGSTCCSAPGSYTPADFRVYQNGSFVFTGNLGIGVSPMQGKGYRTSWDSYKGAFRSGYADNEWDDANVGFFSWAGGSNSTAVGLYALAFGDTNSAESTSSIVFGSGNQVKGAAGFSAGAGNRVCDTYGVALGNNAKSGGPYINGKCDPDSFNLRGLAAVAIGYNVTADQDHSMAFGKFASNNGFAGTFVWSDGSATASADTFRNLANNEFAARATGGFRFRTNLAGTTGCNLPAGSGVFNCTSSRYTKENFLLTSGNDVLSKLRGIQISTWNYISEGNKVRHMGPMAEDFFQAFQLGTGNTSIGVQDLAGVSLAAIKELDQRTIQLQQRTAEVEGLRSQINALQSANSQMEKRLAALEQLIEKGKARSNRR